MSYIHIKQQLIYLLGPFSLALTNTKFENFTVKSAINHDRFNGKIPKLLPVRAGAIKATKAF